MSTELDPKIQQLLVEFLQDGKTDRRQMKEQVAGATKASSHISNQLNIISSNMDSGFKEIKNEIKGINARLQKLEDEVEDTGRYNVEEIRRKLHEKEQEEKQRNSYWKDKFINFGFYAIPAMGSAVVTYLVTLILK